MTLSSATAECWICATCGTQHAPSSTPPAGCRICLDDRQYVGREGQQWTTHAALAERLHVRVDDDDDVVGVGIVEPFGIPQRALIAATPELTVMWDCISVVTDDALERVGRIDAIAISHPHFYSSMVEWSDALGGVPVFVHEADRDWIHRSSAHVETWGGDRCELAPDLSLLHLPGHFPGSSALLWRRATRTALLAGDSLHVTADRRHVTVMHSVPNYVPVDPDTILDIRHRLIGVDFDDVYGFTWGLNIIGGARAAVEESLQRYLRAVTAPADVRSATAARRRW